MLDNLRDVLDFGTTRFRLTNTEEFEVTIGYDPEAENPLDQVDDRLISFNPRHANYVDPNTLDTTEAIYLGYFEHGNCIWGLKEDIVSLPDFQWDGYYPAGVFIPSPSTLDFSAGLDKVFREEYLHDRARLLCDLYTVWCNGSVYRASVCVRKLCEHCGNVSLEDDLYMDGYYNLDSLKERIYDEIEFRFPCVSDGVTQL